MMMGSQVDAQKDAHDQMVREAEAAATEKLTPAQVVSSLLNHVTGCYSEAEQAKQASGVSAELADSLRRRNGEYTAKELAAFDAEGQVVVWNGKSETKCVNGEAWGNDIMDSVGDQYFVMNPSPRPDLTKEVETTVAKRLLDEVQREVLVNPVIDIQKMMTLRRKFVQEENEIVMAEANEKTDALRRAVCDVLAEIEFSAAKKAMLSDAITFGTGFLKGPIVFPARKGEWRENQYFINNKKISISVSNPHPMDIFPAPSSSKLSDGYVCERVRTSVFLAQNMLVAPGYIKENVREAIKDFHSTTVSNVDDPQRTLAENKPVTPQEKENQFECYEFWGPIMGSELKDFLPEVKDDESYHVQVVFTKRHILRVMHNPLMTVPYDSATYKQRKGSIWGRSVPALIKEAQDMGNGATRALAKNMSICSGPQEIIDVSQFDPKTDFGKMIPYGQHFVNGTGIPGVSRKAIDFFTPECRINDLLAVDTWCNNLADGRCSIPAYTYGNDSVASVGQTSSGLSMMLNAAGRGMKDSLSAVDRACASTIKRIAEWILMYPEVFGYGDEIKGDANVVVRGSMGVLMVELKQARWREMLALFSNPEMAKYVIPNGGWVKMLHEYARVMDISLEGIIPKVNEGFYANSVEKENQAKAALQQMVLNGAGVPGGAAAASGGGQGSSLDTVAGVNANPDKVELTPPNPAGATGGVEQG